MRPPSLLTKQRIRVPRVHEPSEPRPEALVSRSVTVASSQSAIVGLSGDEGCSCGGAAAAEERTPLYAIGSISARIPSRSVEMELAQLPDAAMPQGLADNDPAMQRYFFDTLRFVKNLYIAREMCWVLQLGGGVDSFIIKPTTQDALLSCITALGGNSGNDILRSVVVGWSGGLAPASACNNLSLPLAYVTDLYELSTNAMVEQIQASTGAPADQAALLYVNMLSLANNTGNSDEYRAINFVTTRFAGPYQKAWDFTNSNQDSPYKMQSVSVAPSRVSGGRKVLDVIYTYVQTSGYAPSEQWYCSVDVTGEYPFLVRNYMLQYINAP